MTPFVPDELIEPYYIYRTISKPFASLDLEIFEESMRPFLLSEADSDQEEFVVGYEMPAIIEPASGWAFTQDFRLIPQSHPYGRFVLPELRPSLTAESYRSSKKVKLPEAAVMWENGTNYYHFLNDFAGRLSLLDQAGISRDIPVLLPGAFQTLRLFREFSDACPLFFKRNWVFQQPDTFYEIAGKAYFTQVIPCRRKNFEGVLKEMPLDNTRGAERLFITRNHGAGRTATNLSEVEQIAVDAGFTLIDTQNMTVVQQSQRFSRAGAIAGFHGAGLANLVYSPPGIPVIEIFPGNFYKGAYYWLSSSFGHPYYAVRGERTAHSNFKVTADGVGFDSNFYLPPSKLMETLRQVHEQTFYL